MAQIAAITIPDEDLDDILLSLEPWRAEAVSRAGGEVAFAALTNRQKVRQLLIAIVRTRTRNIRRERAERAVSFADVDAT